MNKDKIYKGIAASPGISIGRAYLYTRKQIKINTQNLSKEEIQQDIKEFLKAIELSRKELTKIYDLAIERIGEKNSKIFEAQIEILNDKYFLKKVIDRIEKEKRSASYIFNDEITKMGQVMLAKDDDYMKERFADVNDIKNRVVRNMNREKLVSKVEENSIIIAHDLTPGDTILFSKRKVQGYVTDTGGVTSHAAIISRALQIPAVVGMKIISGAVLPGEKIIVDGYAGIIITNPTEKTFAEYEDKIRAHREYEEKLFGIIDLPDVTLDGKHIGLAVNIDLDEETQFLEKSKNCGVGLYRTEHLFIEKGQFPSEDEQIEEYSHISKIAYPNSVTFRTFDIGGDKLLPSSEKEDNPFLGWRGIRISLDKINIFKEQLRAMLIASGKKKNVKIMLPMISSLEEVRRSKIIFSQVKGELDIEEIKYDKKSKLGIMIEVPSAFMLANELANEVDFFSVGTNDLIQYILAVDRGNELVSDMYCEFHPAVIRALKQIADAARSHKIPVSICGEMASNPLSTIILIGLGFNELSVVPSAFPQIKQIIRSAKFLEAEEFAKKILTLSTIDEIKEETDKFYKEKVYPYITQYN